MSANRQLEAGPTARGVTARAVAIGLLCIVAVILLIHWAELVLGGSRGHSAMANTSIPLGTFAALMLVVSINSALGRWRRGWQLNSSELVVVYAMTAVATVLASSGAIHFLVPAMAAPLGFASPENRWEALFFQYIPPWIGPDDPRLLRTSSRVACPSRSACGCGRSRSGPASSSRTPRARSRSCCSCGGSGSRASA